MRVMLYRMDRCSTSVEVCPYFSEAPLQQEENVMAEDYEYDVFISYRTSIFPDRPVAAALQQLLERFPIPKTFRHAVAVPNGRRTQLRVFRDTTDLNPSSNLDEALKGKLRRSRFL